MECSKDNNTTQSVTVTQGQRHRSKMADTGLEGCPDESDCPLRDRKDSVPPDPIPQSHP